MSAPDLGGELFAPSLVEATIRRLRDEILSGARAPGERLVEEQIRRRYAISRAPLREALRMLAEQGLIEHLPRRGARVAIWSDVDIAQLFDLRLVLERYAVSITFPLVEKPGVDSLAPVRACLDQMRVAQAGHDDLAKDDAHRAFHASVVALAGNQQLDKALEPILIKLQRPMALNLRREAALIGPQEGLQRHERMLRALETNDRDTVLTELVGHGSRRFLPGVEEHATRVAVSVSVD